MKSEYKIHLSAECRAHYVRQEFLHNRCSSITQHTRCFSLLSDEREIAFHMKGQKKYKKRQKLKKSVVRRWLLHSTYPLQAANSSVIVDVSRQCFYSSTSHHTGKREEEREPKKRENRVSREMRVRTRGNFTHISS